MNAEIITIGNELLDGKIRDSNAVFISKKLQEEGISIIRITTVGDEINAIQKAFQSAFKIADLVISTGGLGPTHDDVTPMAVARLLNCDLRWDPDTVRTVRSFFRKWNRPFPVNQKYLPPKKTTLASGKLDFVLKIAPGLKQVLVPVKATPIQNRYGTAPVLQFKVNKKFGFCLPGVPKEMENLIEKEVIPRLRIRPSKKFLSETVIHTTGVGESTLFSQLDNLGEIEKIATVAFLPHPEGVDIQLKGIGKSKIEVKDRLTKAEHLVRKKLAESIYGKDSDTLETLVGKLLRNKGLTLATAESCTGGMISDRITNVSGSSNYFLEGLVPYSNEAKQRLLGVPLKLLKAYGAVSEPVAKSMAERVRKRCGSDIGLSTTGIAGPTGGTPTKPVGLVYIGYSDSRETTVFKFVFTKVRLLNKIKTTQAALDLLRKKLQNRSRTKNG